MPNGNATDETPIDETCASTVYSSISLCLASVPSTLPHAGSLGDDGLEGFLKATWRRACLARAKALVRAPLDTLEAGTLPMWIDLSNLRSSSSRLLTGGVAASSSTLPRPNCDGALSEEVSEWCATSEEDFGGNGRDSPPSVCSLLRDGGKLILPLSLIHI